MTGPEQKRWSGNIAIFRDLLKKCEGKNANIRRFEGGSWHDSTTEHWTVGLFSDWCIASFEVKQIFCQLLSLNICEEFTMFKWKFRKMACEEWNPHNSCRGSLWKWKASHNKIIKLNVFICSPWHHRDGTCGSISEHFAIDVHALFIKQKTNAERWNAICQQTCAKILNKVQFIYWKL